MSEAAATAAGEPAMTPAVLQAKIDQKIQYFLDKATPHTAARWAGWGVALLLYAIRVLYLKGFYIITYGLGIYNLNLLLGFLTPQMDPDQQTDGPDLPTKSSQEFKPFVRKLPEFKFWYSSLKSILTGTVMTLFPMFDVPVFWPILLVYWLVLFTITMKRQIKHMIKYKYVPWSTGKKKYTGPGKGPAPAGKGSD